MFKWMRTLAVVAALTATLGGCVNSGMGNKQTAGAVGGAVIGGLAGSRFGGGSGKLVAVGIGTLLGAAIGSSIGKSLDTADQLALERAHYQAYSAPVGQSIQWRDPQSSTGAYGTVMTTREGTAGDGSYCREYQQTIVVGGQTQQGYGTACRQVDGSWRIAG